MEFEHDEPESGSWYEACNIHRDCKGDNPMRGASVFLIILILAGALWIGYSGRNAQVVQGQLDACNQSLGKVARDYSTCQVERDTTAVNLKKANQQMQNCQIVSTGFTTGMGQVLSEPASLPSDSNPSSGSDFSINILYAVALIVIVAAAFVFLAIRLWHYTPAETARAYTHTEENTVQIKVTRQEAEEIWRRRREQR
jgi:hypothetical protein